MCCPILHLKITVNILIKNVKERIKFTAKSCKMRICEKYLGHDIENSQAQTFKIRVKMYGTKNEFTKISVITSLKVKWFNRLKSS